MRKVVCMILSPAPGAQLPASGLSLTRIIVSTSAPSVRAVELDGFFSAAVEIEIDLEHRSEFRS